MLPATESNARTTPLRVVLLGLGRWGANHLRVLRGLPVELYCVDTAPARLSKLAESGFPAQRLSTDPYQFLTQVDCAVVATPAETHYELCRRYLEADKDVFVEKPLTLASRDSKELAELAERRARILQVGHIFRFDPAAQWLKEAIGKGEFGQLKILRGNFSGFKRPRNDSGVTFADAIHFVDLFNLFMDRPPVRVTAVLNDFLGRGMDDESWIALDYELPGGVVSAMVETGYHTPGKYREVKVMGHKASAICDFNVAQYKVRMVDARHEVGQNGVVAVEETSRLLEFPPEEPLLAEVRAFLDSVGTRAAPAADGWAGYWAVRVIERALESAQQRKTLSLDG
ncbi:MAG TPA: Gfo/Idh/MocA family oxidoreductase [Gammaproteobacteria bacterium]|nr:Gfo/Idh/MocA family oxidoreductase [Gammaproteobacteria bacterium]